MAKKLNTYVHVIGRDNDGNQTNAGVFGPDDTVPEWAAKAITNPDVWAEDPTGDSHTETPPAAAPAAGPGPAGERPPTSGAGSGRDAWAAYATERGVTVTDDMDRGAIIAAVDRA